MSFRSPPGGFSTTQDPRDNELKKRFRVTKWPILAFCAWMILLRWLEVHG